ncbi:MAG: DUF5698 domain-containing protein [Candidatus Palauibacterales bacterium]|nr:DUF5698 domain-containing protein [Candidatus Palauibacterales bacterium]
MIELLAGPWGPVLIFLLRVGDVSLGTLRVRLVTRGSRVIAPLVSFVEILIWVLAAGAALQNLSSPLHVVGYAAGFAGGTALGVWLEEKLALGLSTVQAICRDGGDAVASGLRDLGVGVTAVRGEGREGSVDIVSTVIRRRDVPEIIDEIERIDPDVFITVYDDTHIRRGWIPTGRRK